LYDRPRCIHSTQSVQANEARLEVLLARDSVLLKAYEEAAHALSRISDSGSEEYEQSLTDLILQGLYKLRDSEVIIRCREQDLDIVSDILPAIPEKYLAAIGHPVELKLDDVHFLDKSTCGGVELLSTGGRVLIENTFQSRLDIAYKQNMPAIRKILFRDV
jgi:V-type H+-transporting ATPase subunit E